MKKLDHSYVAGGNVKWYSHSGKQLGGFLRNKTKQPKGVITYYIAIALLRD